MRYPMGSSPPAAVRPAGKPMGTRDRERSQGWNPVIMMILRATSVADMVRVALAQPLVPAFSHIDVPESQRGRDYRT